MKFDQLVKLYEAEQSGPPYIRKDTYDGTRLKNSVFYYKDPEYKILHREDGPAQIWTMKTNEPVTTGWWLNGKRHRIGGPAYENGQGETEWFVDGIRHRLDGPAITRADGTRIWFVDGKKHRIGGPAYENAEGHKEWYVDGKKHRLDGPAVIRRDGTKSWWINNHELTKEEVEEHKKKLAVTKEIQSHENNRIDPEMLEDYL